MDILTTIEQRIQTMLLKIDGTTQPNGYTYYTQTGLVSIDDEVKAEVIGDSLGQYINIDYTIEQDDNGETNLEWGDSTDQYTNELFYIITARVITDPTSNTPKFDAKQKCNEVLADVKYALSHNTTLHGDLNDGIVNWIKYDSSERDYNSSQNLTRVANLIITVEVNYSQSFNNPDLTGCN